MDEPKFNPGEETKVPKKHGTPVHKEPTKEYFDERNEQELLEDVRDMAPKALLYFLNPIKSLRDKVKIPSSVKQAAANRWLWYSQHGTNYMTGFVSYDEFVDGDRGAREILAKAEDSSTQPE